MVLVSRELEVSPEPPKGVQELVTELVSLNRTLFGVLATMQSWVPDAACANPSVDPRIFFPTVTTDGTGSKKGAERMRRICNSCPVRIQCLAHAIAFEGHGSWGGHTREEIATMRKRMRVRLTDLGSRIDMRESNC